jgi:hypothetical protein
VGIKIRYEIQHPETGIKASIETVGKGADECTTKAFAWQRKNYPGWVFCKHRILDLAHNTVA